MVVDSSALLAIVRDEPEARSFSRALQRTDDPVLSSVAYVECALALVGELGADGPARLRGAVSALGLRRVAVGCTVADAAAEACRSFSATSSPARLDAADFVSYALAQTLGRPLLFRGGDFLRTDVAVAC